MSSAACSCPSNSLTMGSLILENRLSNPSAPSLQKSSPRRHTVSTNHDSTSSRVSILAAVTPSSPIKMDHRHYGRPSSPGGRKIAHPERYSAGNLGSYDPYNTNRASREYISPRTSGDRVIVPHSPQYTTHPSSSSNSTISRSSAGYDAYSGRPRRSTLEGDSRRPANLSLSSRHRPAVIHANDNRPSSPLARTYDERDRGRESYVAQPTSVPRREHKKVYSIDDGQSRLIDERDIEPRRDQRSNAERSGHKSTHVGGSRQQYYPSAPAPRDNEEYYSYTDPAKMYAETEPSWRPRRGSVGRGSRPSSVIIEPSAAPRITREYGPPPSTRGFDKINGGVSRTGSVRDTHKRTSSRERERQVPHTTVYRDNIPDPYILPQDVPPRSNSAIPAPRALQDTRDDGRGHRDYDDRRDGRHHQRRLTYEDPEVATRGFCIRSGSVDRYARDPSLDRAPIYPAVPAEAPIAIPNPRDYLPAESLPPPIPPPVRDNRDGRREHDCMDREWAGEYDRDRDRDRDYRDKHRDHKDRERERDRDRDRDRPRDREREREYGRDDKDRERDRDRDRDRDRYTERDDRIRTKDQDDRHHHKDFVPAVAVAGTAASAAAAYGSHTGDRKGRDDRRDDRRYDDDRRPPPIAAPVDHRPLASSLEERRAPPPPDEWGVNVDDRRPNAVPSTDLRALPADRRAPLDDRRAPVEDRRLPVGASIDTRAPHDDRRAPPSDEYRGPVDDRKHPLPEGRSRLPHKLSSESINAPRERHYVDKDSEREAAARQDSKKSEQLDPDEDYRRRLQAVQADLQRGSTVPPPRDRDSSDSDRERRRRDYESDHNVERAHSITTPTSSLPKNIPGAYPVAAAIPVHESDRDFRDRDTPSRVPPQSDRSMDRSNNGLFGAPLVNDPEEYGDKQDQQEREGRVQIVAPPKGSPPAPKGILRRPTAKFPEDPNPIREGVAPLKDAKKGKDIPINARWTKIDRRLVNPEALKEAKERFEERLDCVIVLRVLSKEDIQKLADRTRDIRERREEGDRGNYELSLVNSGVAVGKRHKHDEPTRKSGGLSDNCMVEYKTKVNESTGLAAKSPALQIPLEQASTLTLDERTDISPAEHSHLDCSDSREPGHRLGQRCGVEQLTPYIRSHQEPSTSPSRKPDSNYGKLKDLREALNPFKKRDSKSRKGDPGNTPSNTFQAPGPSEAKSLQCSNQRCGSGLSSLATNILTNVLTHGASSKDDDRYREYDRDDNRSREQHRRREKKRDGYDDDTESDFYSDEYDDRERRDRDRDYGRDHRRDVEAPATTAA